MIVHRHGDHLFGMLLPYHILVQTCLDLVGRGNIPDVQYGLGILLFLLFLDLLLVRDTALSLQIRYVYKTDIGHAVALVHTVVADTDIVGKFEHLSRLALRSAADKTYILVIAAFIRLSLFAVLAVRLLRCGLLQLFQFFFLIVLICHL